MLLRDDQGACSGPSLAFLNSLSVLLVQRQRLGELPGGLVAQREVVHAGEGGGVVGAELGLPQLQRLLVQRQRLGELPGGPVALREVVHAGEGVVGLASQGLLPQRQRLVQLPGG
jgi:hypothetical protein